MLYSAQQNPQSAALQPQIQTTPAPVGEYTQKTSLHSFWTIPSRPSSCGSSFASASPAPALASLQAMNCEDCDTALVSNDGDAMDLDIDVAVYGSSSNYGCSQCGKNVCHRCAISNLGEHRRCLICAGKKQWIGGLGWVLSN
jgi:hypothetical protein